MRTKEKHSIEQMSNLLEVLSPREAACLKGGDGGGTPWTCVFEAVTFAYNNYGSCGSTSVDAVSYDFLQMYGTEAFDDAVFGEGFTTEQTVGITNNYFTTETFSDHSDLTTYLEAAPGNIAMVSINNHAVIAVGYDSLENEIIYRDPEDEPDADKRASINDVQTELMVGLYDCNSPF